MIFGKGMDGMTEVCEFSSMSKEGKKLPGHERLKCFLPRKENAQSQSDHSGKQNLLKPPPPKPKKKRATKNTKPNSNK